LEGGGSILVEAPAAARAVLDQLREAGPAEVEVEFGVDLAVQAEAVITKSEAGCHLRVKLTWKNGEGGDGGQSPR
jgi:hypothetical protein